MRRILLPLIGVAFIVAIRLLRLSPAWESVLIAVQVAGHFCAYSALLAWFGLSLRRRSEPVITVFARRVRKTMPPPVVRYTRGVTIAWCVFCAAQLSTSALLMCLGDRIAWLDFVTVWNLPLVAAMVLGEFGLRSVLFRREERTGLWNTLTALRDFRIGRLS